MDKRLQRLSLANRAAGLWVWLLALMLFVLCSCAPGGYYQAGEPPVAYPKYFEKPSGPGTVPSHWYGNDPALEGWFDPWYVNPYQQ